MHFISGLIPVKTGQERALCDFSVRSSEHCSQTGEQIIEFFQFVSYINCALMASANVCSQLIYDRTAREWVRARVAAWRQYMWVSGNGEMEVEAHKSCCCRYERMCVFDLHTAAECVHCRPVCLLVTGAAPENIAHAKCDAWLTSTKMRLPGQRPCRGCELWMDLLCVALRQALAAICSQQK